MVVGRFYEYSVSNVSVGGALTRGTYKADEPVSSSTSSIRLLLVRSASDALNLLFC